MIDAWGERLARGDVVDPEQEIRARPHLAARLRAGFDALSALGREFGRDPAAALVGRTLGAWRLDSVLGSGGMGAVYLATGAGGARAAVKVLHPHLLERPGFFQRFLREAEIGRRVRHANVVRTLDAGECVDAGTRRRFLVMEYVEGRTLRSLLAESGRVPEALCRHIGREIAAALAAIHAAGAVHRDIKPENVLITNEHAVKVMDLGVSRLADEAARLSQTGAFVGSLLYGAPEQFSRESDVDGRVDLHALGLVLYELATGVHPFAHDDFRVVVRRIADQTPRRCGEVDPQIAPFFEEVVATLLAKSPGDRFATAEEVLRVLGEGEESVWWRERATAMRRETRRPLRRIRIPRETALYGRDTETARLRSLFERAKARDGQVALLEGEAGIGKSRLVDEFVASLVAAGEDVDFLFGSYPPGGAASASGAFTTAYREHLGDDEAALREALPQTPLLVPAYAALLRGDAPPEGAEKLTTDSIRTLFVHATRSCAARRTTVVLIDDLHFAPEEGRALFTSLALAAPGHRILLIGGARPSLDEKWAAGFARLPNATRMPLARLSPKELVALLKDALRSEHLATELAGKIGEKSDGNPFFVFEILRGLREGNFLAKRPDGTWVTTRIIREIAIPPSIVEVIQARVLDLREEERSVLEVAACVGFEFDAALVGAVLRVEPIPLLQRLGRIEKAHRLVRSVGHRFQFDHHQVQEVLYAGLSAPLREAYHAAIGAAIEERSGAASREPKELDGGLTVELADHLFRGAKDERAMRYLDAAFAHLESRWLNDAALRLVDRALASPALVSGDTRCDLLIRKSVRLQLLGRRDAERAADDEAIALADAGGDAKRRLKARFRLGLHLWRVALYPEAQTVFEETLELARGAGDRQYEGWATGNLGNIFSALGRFADALAQYERSLAIAREAGDRHGEAYAIGNIGNVFESVSRFADAHAQYELDLALLLELGDRAGEVTTRGNLGSVLRSLGRFADAQAQFERQLALAREIGDRRGEVNALLLLGTSCLTLGDIDRARQVLDASILLCREIVSPYTEGVALLVLGEIFDEAGDAARALACIEEGLAVCRRIGNAAGVGMAMLQIGQLRWRTGDAEGARAAAEEGTSLSREQASASRVALGLALLARLPGGDANAAQAALKSGGDGLDVSEAAQAHFLLWEATRDRAHLAEAKRRVDLLVEHAPPERRESMLTKIRLHRDVVAAWREHGAA